MNKNIAIGVLGLALLGSLAVSGVFASSNERGQMGMNYSPERHEQMTQAFADNNYTTWKNLMGERGATRAVTQENFNRFTEMHNLMLEGKTDEANTIRQELGLGNGQGRGMRGENRGQNNGGNFIDSDNNGICDHMQ